MIYGRETWSIRAEDMQRMDRTERIMVRLGQEVCGRFERKIGDRKCVRCHKKRQTEMVWSYGEEGGL
jgi:hypothetical protein